jgi:hypothetical protein
MPVLWVRNKLDKITEGTKKNELVARCIAQVKSFSPQEKNADVFARGDTR